MRTKDVGKIEDAVYEYKDDIKGFYPYEWVLDDRNVALTNTDDDIALFEHLVPGVVIGHYFFWSRGKNAISNAKDFLREIFTQYDVQVVQGWTPLLNRKARWMSHHLGFKSYGILHTHEPCELVMMTKQEWENLYG